MNAFNRILVGLDLSPIDTRLMEYLELFNQGFPPAKAFFLHVSYAQQMPVMVGGRYTREPPDQELMNSTAQRYAAAMADEARTVLDPDRYEADFEVVEGTITRQMLDYAEDREVDLTILGRKKVHQGSGVAAARYLRNTHSSVLFVPEDKAPKLQHLMIATDFSEYNEFAVRRAIELAQSLPEPPHITLLHVYDVPTDVAFKISRTQSQYARIIHESVASMVPQYLDRFDWGDLAVTPKLVENTHYNAARHVYEAAQEVDPDLLIIGARGHSSLSAWLLGSMPEKLLRYNEKTPLLIVRSE